jgi:CDGSH-type Zn-finger protein
VPTVPPPPAEEGGAGRPERRPRRDLLEPGGPILVEGPVEVMLPDGSTARSDRFMVAVCACRRSRSYPWCDTSHRRRARAERKEHGERDERGEPDGPEARGSGAEDGEPPRP